MKKERRNKFRKGLKAVGFVIPIVAVVIVLMSFSENPFKSENSVEEVFLQYASDYEILEETDDKIQLSVTCPDFEAITRQMAQEDVDITSKNLKKAIKNSSSTDKEYIFTVTELTDEAINSAFLEKVAYELMISAIQEVEYQESWGFEE